LKKLLVVLAVLAMLAIALPVSAAPPWRGILGDVNGDGKADSTDYLIIMSADVGMSGTARFCPMNCGDVNRAGLVNSTDALIILVYDVGFPVPYPVGVRGCPRFVWQPPGCFVR